MFNIKQSSSSEEEYIAKVLATFLKIRQQDEKSIALQLTQLLQQYKQQEIDQLQNLKLEQQKMEKQITTNLKQEQHKYSEKVEQPIKPIKSKTNTKDKDHKYSDYGIFQDGSFTCLKCNSKVKRAQDLLKHWTMQHGRQVVQRRKRTILNEDTQCIKKISIEKLKSESQSDQ